jgi:hypothetical protein
MSKKVIKKSAPAPEVRRAKKKKAVKKSNPVVPVSDLKVEDVLDDEKMGAVADESASVAIRKMQGAVGDKTHKYTAAPGSNPVVTTPEPVVVDTSGKITALDRPWIEIQELTKPGVYEIYFVEYVIDTSVKPSKYKWEIDQGTNTLKKALNLSRQVRLNMIGQAAEVRESEWYRVHMHDQKTADQAVFKITAKTTDDEMLAWLARAQEIRAELVDTKPIKPPKFKPVPGDKDYPIVRVRKMTVGVQFTEVPTS